MEIKTIHGRLPKAWLEEQMKEFPSGTWIVLEGKTYKGSNLLSIGYKYNKSNILTFVFTHGAGSTEEGRPYQARFPDIFGNAHTRNAPRPKVLNTYYDDAVLVDSHNQARHIFLGLEECWVTQNPYFRIWTTFLGMCMTDLWKI